MMYDHDFIQEVVQIQGKSPCVVLYTDKQLLDIANFCAGQAGVLGVDRTFNLGACYVTSIVFKIQN